MSEEKFDVRDFRRTLGQFPTGVTVITTRADDGEPIGVTASSFNSVSVDPPLVLWSVDRSAYSANIFDRAEHFAVNVLASNQMDISNRFAGRGEDKYAGIDYSNGIGGSPLLSGCAAQFQCKTWAKYDGGDHIIIVGEVLAYTREETVSPLVFSQGSYALSVPYTSTTPQPVEAATDNEFLGDYLLYLLRIAYTNYSNKLYPALADKFTIAPAEWRILSVLPTSSGVEIKKLAQLVIQPIKECRDTVEIMAAKGLLIKSEDDCVLLAEPGQALYSEISSFAKAQEQTIFARTADTDEAALKQGLKQIIGALSAG